MLSDTVSTRELTLKDPHALEGPAKSNVRFAAKAGRALPLESIGSNCFSVDRRVLNYGRPTPFEHLRSIQAASRQANMQQKATNKQTGEMSGRARCLTC